MTQPFIIAMKLTGDGSSAIAAVRDTRREIDVLAQATIKTAIGQRDVLADIDRMFSSNTAFKTTQEDINLMGRELDALCGQYNPLFAAEQRHEANLAGIQRAYTLGAISADEMSAAVDREKMAHTTAVTALDGHTGALMRNNRANAQRTNLLFQLQDIGVSLAGGMNPLMVAAQQGSQISMIYGPEEGGLGKALSETGKMAGGLVTKLLPVALAVGAGAAAIAGMRHEIEETSGAAVSFGDTMMAVFQVTGDAIYNQFKPQLEAISSWWSSEWDLFVKQTKEGGNFIVRETIGAVSIINAVIMSVPDAFIVAAEASAEGFANTIIWGFREVQVGANNLINELNGMASKVGMGQVFGTMDLMGYADLDLGGDAAAKRLSAGWGDLNAKLKEVADTDYMGQFFSSVQTQAIKNYNAGLDDTGKAAIDAATGVGKAKTAVATLNQEAGFYKSTFSGFVTDIFKGLREGENAWERFGSAAVSALDKIADRAIGMAADGFFDMISGAVTGAIGGGGQWNIPKTFVSGGFFPGFDSGGWTGGVAGQVRGVVHGEEFVVKAGPAQQHRAMLEEINAGGSLQTGGRSGVTLQNSYTFQGSGFTEAQARRLMDDNNRTLFERLPSVMADANRRAVGG